MDNKLLQYLKSCIDGLMSRNSVIRNSAFYILFHLEVNYNRKYKKSFLGNELVHSNLFNMMKLYSNNKYAIQQGFALLVQFAKGGEKTVCLNLLKDGVIDIIETKLADIDSVFNKMMPCDLDVLKSASQFVSHITYQGETSNTMDIVRIVLKILKLIVNKHEIEFKDIIFYNLRTIFNIISGKKFDKILRHYMFVKMTEDNGRLLTSILHWSKYKKVIPIRCTALCIIDEFLRHVDTFVCSIHKLVYHYRIIEYIKQCIVIHVNGEKWDEEERQKVLSILLGIVKCGHAPKYFDLLLQDNDIMNVIGKALKSKRRNEWTIAIEFVISVLTQVINDKTKIDTASNKIYWSEDFDESYLNAYKKCLTKLFYWKEGSMISDLCVWFDNYQDISLNMTKYDVQNMFLFFKIMVLIIKNNWIEVKYIKHKFNENGLMECLIKNGFVIYDYKTDNDQILKVNKGLLRYIAKEHQFCVAPLDTELDILYDNILFLTRLCEEALGFVLHK